MKERLRKLKHAARRTDGTVFQFIGASKFKNGQKWRGRWRNGAGRNFGAVDRGRALSLEERKAIEDEMRREGKLAA